MPVAVVPASGADNASALVISYAELEALGAGGKKRLRLSAVVDGVLSSAAHRARVEAAVLQCLHSAHARGAVRFDGKKIKAAKRKQK